MNEVNNHLLIGVCVGGVSSLSIFNIHLLFPRSLARFDKYSVDSEAKEISV